MPQPKNIEIDKRLDSLYESAQYGHEFTLKEIADAVGCSERYIAKLERSAMAKLRERLVERSVATAS